ncbi:hypothetical protein JTB14_014476 [Gonioctena quinquepunctata]|nr:hypothetical protein JTB14_014476 [Gonioctena quinquepunctata]
MVEARDVVFIENFGNHQNPVNIDANVPLHQVLSQESSDEVQGDMVDMVDIVEEGESQHTERYEDHSSSENVFDSDREERRYPLRGRKPKDFSNFELYHTISEIEDDTVTVEDAMSRYDREMWKNAMKDEYNSLIENKVWELVDLPGGRSLACDSVRAVSPSVRFSLSAAPFCSGDYGIVIV